MFLSFYCIGCESFAVFIKSFFDHKRRLLNRPSLIHVRVKLQIHFAQDSRILGSDHLIWTCDGTFERLLARGDRDFEQ